MSRRSDGEGGGRREAKVSRTISELKAENKILKRKISRLEKRLMRFSDDDYIEESPSEESPEPMPKKVQTLKCPECDGTEFVELDTPSRVMVICKACKTRMN